MNATVTNRRSPAAEEPIAASFIEFLGGKLGRHAQIGTQRYWTPLRVLFMFAVLFLGLGYLSKANCLASVGPPGQALLDWSGNRQYTSACYNDIITSYGNYSHAFPYASSPRLSCLKAEWISSSVKGKKKMCIFRFSASP